MSKIFQNSIFINEEKCNRNFIQDMKLNEIYWQTHISRFKRISSKVQSFAHLDANY